jgi:hypothetical protein
VEKPAVRSYGVLNPRQTRISRDPHGRLSLQTAGEEPINGLKAVRAFPLTAPSRLISLMDDEGHEVAVIADSRQLPEESQRILEEELEVTYFMPQVLRIRTVTGIHGMTTWELETDRGNTTAYVRDRNDIRRLPGGRVVLVDVHGIKYDIPNWHNLDPRSAELLEQEM